MRKKQGLHKNLECERLHFFRNSNMCYDNISNVAYNLKQLIFATNKFRKDDVGIRYTPIEKRMSVNVANTVICVSKVMLP